MVKVPVRRAVFKTPTGTTVLTRGVTPSAPVSRAHVTPSKRKARHYFYEKGKLVGVVEKNGKTLYVTPSKARELERTIEAKAPVRETIPTGQVRPMSVREGMEMAKRVTQAQARGEPYQQYIPQLQPAKIESVQIIPRDPYTQRQIGFQEWSKEKGIIREERKTPIEVMERDYGTMTIQEKVGLLKPLSSVRSFEEGVKGVEIFGTGMAETGVMFVPSLVYLGGQALIDPFRAGGEFGAGLMGDPLRPTYTMGAFLGASAYGLGYGGIKRTIISRKPIKTTVFSIGELDKVYKVKSKSITGDIYLDVKGVDIGVSTRGIGKPRATVIAGSGGGEIFVPKELGKFGVKGKLPAGMKKFLYETKEIPTPEKIIKTKTKPFSVGIYKGKLLKVGIEKEIKIPKPLVKKIKISEIKFRKDYGEAKGLDLKLEVDKVISTPEDTFSIYPYRESRFIKPKIEPRITTEVGYPRAFSRIGEPSFKISRIEIPKRFRKTVFKYERSKIISGEGVSAGFIKFPKIKTGIKEGISISAGELRELPYAEMIKKSDKFTRSTVERYKPSGERVGKFRSLEYHRTIDRKFQVSRGFGRGYKGLPFEKYGIFKLKSEARWRELPKMDLTRLEPLAPKEPPFKFEILETRPKYKPRFIHPEESFRDMFAEGRPTREGTTTQLMKGKVSSREWIQRARQQSEMVAWESQRLLEMMEAEQLYGVGVKTGIGGRLDVKPPILLSGEKGYGGFVYETMEKYKPEEKFRRIERQFRTVEAKKGLIPSTALKTTPIQLESRTPTEYTGVTPTETPIEIIEETTYWWQRGKQRYYDYEPPPIIIPTTVPPFTPYTPPFALFPGLAGAGGRRRPRKRKKRKQPKKYRPSLTAIVFGIRGKQPKFVTGLGIRPMRRIRIKKRKVKRKKRKKRKKR